MCHPWLLRLCICLLAVLAFRRLYENTKLTAAALCYAGIGKFTIADDAVVRDSDLGVNFFLDENGLGKSRAQHCTELLVELNPEVKGDWFPKNGVRRWARKQASPS